MFKTKNDTHVYIVGALQDGTFKHCVHLTLGVTGQFRSRPWEPYCAKHNFVRCDRNQFHYCCPDTCCSFEDRRAAERAQKRAVGTMFEQKYDAYAVIARGKKEGVFKNCLHLDVEGGSNGMQFNPYRPYCRVDCLIEYNQNKFQNREWGARCPEDCYLFVDKKTAERAKRWGKRWEAMKAAIREPVRYFAKLPGITQALILLLLLAWVLPKSLKTVLQIWKAVK